MGEAPDRIFATVNGMSTRLPDGGRQFVGGWSQDPERPGVTEYIRADLYAALEAEIARLKEERHFWKTEYLNASADAAKFANDLVRTEARLAEVENALNEAADALDAAMEDVEHWGSYAGEYFQDKHDLDGDLDRISEQAAAARRALEGGE